MGRVMRVLLKVIFFIIVSTSVWSRPKIGLVLGGGGALGYAHVGAIEVIEELGLPIDIVTGVSMGSLIGAYYALGYNATELDQLIRKIDMQSLMNGLQRRVYNNPIRREQEHMGVLNLLYRHDFSAPEATGVSSAYSLENFLDRIYWQAGFYSDFTHFPRSFATSATNLQDGDRVVYKSGSLGSAVRASVAVPGVFTPATMNGNLMVDGGLSGSFLIQEAIDLGADIVILVDLSDYDDNVAAEPVNTITGMIAVLMSKSREVDMAAMPLVDIHVKPSMAGYSPLSFGDYDGLKERGRDAVLAISDQLEVIVNQLNQEEIMPVQAQESDAMLIESIEVLGLEMDRAATTRLINQIDLDFGSKMMPDKVAMEVLRAANKNFYKRIRYWVNEKILYLYAEEEPFLRISAMAQLASDFGLRLGAGFGITHIENVGAFDLNSYLGYQNGLEAMVHFNYFPGSLSWFSTFIYLDVFDSNTYSNLVPSSNVFNTYRSLPGNYEMEIGVQFAYKNYFYLQLSGIGGRWNSVNVTNPLFEQKDGQLFGEGNIAFVFDQLNDRFYPTRGYRIGLHFSGGVQSDEVSVGEYMYTSFDWQYVQTLPQSFSLLWAGVGSTLWGENPNLHRYALVGGMLGEQGTHILPGYALASLSGRSMLGFKTALQYSFFFRFMVALEWYGYLLDENFVDLFKKENFYQSAGTKVVANLGFAYVDLGVYYNFLHQSAYLVATLGSRF